jgi:hypothetical protein
LSRARQEAEFEKGLTSEARSSSKIRNRLACRSISSFLQRAICSSNLPIKLGKEAIRRLYQFVVCQWLSVPMTRSLQNEGSNLALITSGQGVESGEVLLGVNRHSMSPKAPNILQDPL